MDIKEYTTRKKSLLKKQIKDLKKYLDVHLPMIVEDRNELINLGQGTKQLIFNFISYKLNANINTKNLQKEPNGHQKNYKIKN